MRKIIQIAAHGSTSPGTNDDLQETPSAIIALCDDGTVWSMWHECIPLKDLTWCRLPNIKQDEDMQLPKETS